MYQTYNKVFYDTMAAGMTINTTFEALKSTSYWEQYMVNAFQFSAAKNRAEMKLLQEMVFKKDGSKKSFSEFKKDATHILEQFNKTWLRVEYDLANRGAIMAEKWQQIYKDRDINPYMIYRTRRDGRVRPEHAELDGLVLEIGSAKAQLLYPPNGWNCRCTVETSYKGSPISDKEADKYLNSSVPKEFQSNVGVSGIFPKDSSYNKILGSANDANYTMFNSRTLLTELNTSLYDKVELRKAIRNWKNTDRDEVIFQNKEFMLNIFLTQSSLDNIGGKLRGVENIKEAITKPSEIWARWTDEKEQKNVHLNFILNSNDKSYIVETEKGIIKDAYLLSSQASINKRRTGIKMMK